MQRLSLEITNLNLKKMSDMFDDLFEKFFGRKPKPEVPKEEPEKPVGNDFVSKLLNAIREKDGFVKNFGKSINVEYFQQDGMYYKRESWLVEGGGKMTQLRSSFTPFEDEPVVLTYEEQLEIALENEDYEEAAILRDKINKK